MSEILGQISVCTCCMLVHANGECCGEHEGPEPLSLIGAGRSVTAGLSADEHSEHCTPEDRESGACDCEVLGFSWQSCEGCGSPLGGDRFALTLWVDSHIMRPVAMGVDGRVQVVRCACGDESEPFPADAPWEPVAAGHAVCGVLLPSPDWGHAVSV